jgi:hypothetical protein
MFLLYKCKRRRGFQCVATLFQIFKKFLSEHKQKVMDLSDSRPARRPLSSISALASAGQAKSVRYLYPISQSAGQPGGHSPQYQAKSVRYLYPTPI